MKYSFYKIRSQSNMHVGSGQSSYGIVDNIVQKDLISLFPCINSTSLKGALREWMVKELKKNQAANAIFGYGNEQTNGKEIDVHTNKQGSHHFFQASLLSYPMRSDKVQYFNVTCPRIISDLKNYLNLFEISSFNNDLENLLQNAKPEKDKPVSLNNTSGAIVEMHKIKTILTAGLIYSTNIKTLFGSNLVVMENAQFSELIKKLPVITRNNLENGQSTNLFYEEVVPRETYFGFLVGSQDNTNPCFDTEIGTNKLLQIGANATVGYGFCELTKIK